MLDLGFIHALKRIDTMLPKKRQSLFFSATMPKAIAELGDRFLNRSDQGLGRAAGDHGRAGRAVRHLLQRRREAGAADDEAAFGADRARADLHPHQAWRRSRGEEPQRRRHRRDGDPRQQEPAAARARARHVPHRRDQDPRRDRHRRARHRHRRRQPCVQLRAAQRRRAICPPHRPHRARRRLGHRHRLRRGRREALSARHREADADQARSRRRCPRTSSPRRPSCPSRASRTSARRAAPTIVAAIAVAIAPPAPRNYAPRGARSGVGRHAGAVRKTGGR